MSFLWIFDKPFQIKSKILIFKLSPLVIENDLNIEYNIYYFQFQFVNSFLALFYTAFYLQDIEKLKEVRSYLIFLDC